MAKNQSSTVPASPQPGGFAKPPEGSTIRTYKYFNCGGPHTHRRPDGTEETVPCGGKFESTRSGLALIWPEKFILLDEDGEPRPAPDGSNVDAERIARVQKWLRETRGQAVDPCV